ncbi:uncharacterized protein LOC108590531 [Callithrix jacchus]
MAPEGCWEDLQKKVLGCRGVQAGGKGGATSRWGRCWRARLYGSRDGAFRGAPAEAAASLKRTEAVAMWSERAKAAARVWDVVLVGRSEVDFPASRSDKLRRSRGGFHAMGEQEGDFLGSSGLLHMTLFHHFGGRRIFPSVCIREFLDPFVDGQEMKMFSVCMPEIVWNGTFSTRLIRWT